MFCKIEKQITMFKLRNLWILGKDHFEFDLTDILKVTTSHTLKRCTLSYWNMPRPSLQKLLSRWEHVALKRVPYIPFWIDGPFLMCKMSILRGTDASEMQAFELSADSKPDGPLSLVERTWRPFFPKIISYFNSPNQ